MRVRRHAPAARVVAPDYPGFGRSDKPTDTRWYTYDRHFESLERLVEQEILLQINADALVSKRRSAAGRLAERLCRQGIAHVLASDGHRASSWRPVTLLADAVERASAFVGEGRARWMACAVPAAIVTAAEVPAPPPIEARQRWRRLLRRP